jgi:hypothetical protein
MGVAIDLDIGFGTFIHSLDALDEGGAKNVTLEDAEEVIVRDPIKCLLKVKGKHA